MDDILTLASNTVPADWWRIIATIFFGVFLYLFKQAATAFIVMVRDFLKKQLIEFGELKETVQELTEGAKIQLEINKMQNETNKRIEKDIRELRGKPSVNYD